MSMILQTVKREEGSTSTETINYLPQGSTAKRLRNYIHQLEQEAGAEMIKTEPQTLLRSVSPDIQSEASQKLRSRLSEEEYFNIFYEAVNILQQHDGRAGRELFCRHSWPYGPLPIYMEYKEPEPIEGMLYFVKAADKPQRKNWPWTNRGSQNMGRLRVRYWQHKQDPALKRRLMSIMVTPTLASDEVSKPIFSLCHILFHRGIDNSVTDEPTEAST